MSPERFQEHKDHRGIDHVGYRVVSARMDHQLIDELDALARHTGRSRGFYLRAALQEMLPVLKERYWSHDIETRRNELSEYSDIVDRLRDTDTDTQ